MDTKHALYVDNAFELQVLEVGEYLEVIVGGSDIGGKAVVLT